jgi:hypothetical protein
MAARDHPTTGHSSGSGWLLAGYAGAAGFFVQEVFLRTKLIVRNKPQKMLDAESAAAGEDSILSGEPGKKFISEPLPRMCASSTGGG